MIEVDYRIGSEHLVDQLKSMGLPAQMVELTYGDVAFFGNGQDGRISVGIELKKIRDLINSIRDGRLSGHQLPGMTNFYPACMLIVEGLFQPDESGRLQIWSRGGWELLDKPSIMYAEVDNYISTLQWCVNLRFKRTSNERETAHVIANQYRWWSKQYKEHTAHTQFDDPGFVGALPLRPFGVVERASHAILPGLGVQKVQAIARKFPSVFDMALSTEGEWSSVEGIGKTIAHNMVESIHGRYDARQVKRSR